MPQYQLAPDQLGIACPATRRARTTVRFPAWLARLARNVASVRRRDRPGRAPAAGRIELRDGRCIALQPLEVDAAARFQQFIRGLSPASRAMRFHAAITDVPAPALQALTTADQRQHIAWVAEECAEAGRIVG